jgi:hypothetical protein
MKSPFKVTRTCRSISGEPVWTLTRTDGKFLNSDGAVAYNYESEDLALDALRGLSYRYYENLMYQSANLTLSDYTA